MSVRIRNDSKKDILKGFYDPNAPLGLSVSAGKIIRADLLGASNPYLEKQATPCQSSDSILLFPEVILDAGEFFLVKLLVRAIARKWVIWYDMANPMWSS